MSSDEDKTEEVDDYLVSRAILLRNYQIKLLEQAKKQNSIIYLPAGAGKTLIAIHVLCNRTCEINRPYSEGGKRAFFLGITKILAHQIAEVLKVHTKFKVKYLTGDMKLDFWDKNEWLELFEKNHVFVLTGEVFKMLLQMKFISPSKISLVVLDECHHATLDHPYRLALQALNSDDSGEKPLILGLSNTLVSSSPKLHQVKQILLSLENSLNGKIITETQLEEVIGFSVNPDERIVLYEDGPITSLTETILKMYSSICNILKNLKVVSSDSSILSGKGVEFRNTDKIRRIKNFVISSRVLFEDLGAFGGSLSALFFIILFEKIRLLSCDTLECQVLLYVQTELLKIRRVFHKYLGDDESPAIIYNSSSYKVQQLINIIKEMKATTKDKHLSILIFVQERAKAAVLSFLLKKLGANGGEFSFLKPDFISGSSIFSKELMSLEFQNDDIVKNFTTRKINVLVATNVMEEGIDVSACNAVISFDFPLGYRNYFQSRGRARNKESRYFILVEKSDTNKKEDTVHYFRSVKNKVFEALVEEFEASDEDSKNMELETMSFYGKNGKISIDGIMAIKIVERYCAKLPQDKYSHLSPIAWHVNLQNGKKAFIQLPINCPVRDIIEGDLRRSKKLAKRSVFLKAVKVLFDKNELTEDFNPKPKEIREEDFSHLFPQHKNENIDNSLPQPGTKRRKQKYKMKFAESLSGCLPRPGTKVYLHVIDFTVTFEKPKRKIAIYETLLQPGSFALLSTKKLCKILRFPLFLDIGRINCDLLVNYDELVFTEDEINDIRQFHFALFKKVLRILKNSQVFDNRNKEHSFFVVPVDNKEGRYVLNWDLIRCDFCKNNTLALVRYNPVTVRTRKRGYEALRESQEKRETPSNSLVPMDSINGRLLMEMSEDDENQEPTFVPTEADYKYFIVIPNYRGQEFTQQYIVDKFCQDMSPLDPFPKVIYENYVAYYRKNYMIEITNKKQPLLRVCPIYSCSNFNRPKKKREKPEKSKGYEEHLIPELCDVVPFDRAFFLKALLLPTVLNRICHVYCVEEFLRRIVLETGLGVCDLLEGTDWAPLELKCGLDKNDEEPHTSDFMNLKSALPLTKLKNDASANKKTIIDPERHLYEVGLCDLEFNVNFLKELDESEEFEKELQFEEENDEILVFKSSRPSFIPPLSSLKSCNNPSGPDLALLIEACTSRSASDIIDYERLEILGDSFLKFAVSLFLFENFSQNEGFLTSLKGKLIGNRNLMLCGVAKNFPDIINVNDFVPLSDWNPPLITVPEVFVDEIVANNLDPAALYRMEVPFEEQFSGVLSDSTLEKNKEILQNYDKCFDVLTNCLLPYKTISDKTIADCVEAFIGAYLLTLGIPGAFDFLSWLQVLPSHCYYSQLIKKAHEVPLQRDSEPGVMEILSEVFYSDLEETLNYRFKQKALLLEALTHPSFSKNRVTNCYQRLELLGDAVLDFLVTSYIYEYCGNLSPGKITDLRSSLVNNTTFACLSVRFEFHKYLLSFSAALSMAIENFVKFQKSRNHVVHDNVFILLEENDCLVPDSVQVPKALGDIFESLAAAIYLDSGYSLETVWNVYYVLMKREIDEFTKNVPITPIRLLCEICGDKPYFEVEKVSDERVKVSCAVYYDCTEIRGHGFGCNKKDAKRSAVKVILNKILQLKK